MNVNMVILNGPDVIFEFLDRHSANTASRPPNPLIELCAFYGVHAFHYPPR